MRSYLGYIRKRDLKALAVFGITNGIPFIATHNTLQAIAKEGLNKAGKGTLKAFLQIHKDMMKKFLDFKTGKGNKPLNTTYNLNKRTNTYMDGIPIEITKQILGTPTEILRNKLSNIEAPKNRPELVRSIHHAQKTVLDKGHRLEIDMTSNGSIVTNTNRGPITIFQKENGDVNILLGLDNRTLDLSYKRDTNI